MNASPKPVLHFFVGKPGAGKSTLARRIATDSGAMLFCEDEWLTILAVEINSVADYARHAARLRRALEPVVIGLLRRGITVVLDFPCNTVKQRTWVRSLFEAADAAHLLHFLDPPDATCRARLQQRNDDKPEGIYWGHVSQARYDEVVAYINAPQAEEGFDIVRYASDN